ncbi:MAG: GNAT family N-acetyltransferase [Anaerolineae bacterium]|nr:GNAT family N-acetyltransferase [Anaerolineae bacterium]
MTNQTLPEGYIIRPARMEDAATVVAALNAHSQAVLGTDAMDEEELVQDWQEPGYDLDELTRVVAAPDGTIVAYGEFWDRVATHTRPYTYIRVHPDHHDLGIGTFVTNWVEGVARDRLKLADPAYKVSLVAHAYANDAPSLELLDELGYQMTRVFTRMIINLDGNLPEPVWADGIKVISMAEYGAGIDEYRAVCKADVEAFKDHWGIVEQPFEEQFKMFLHDSLDNDRHDPAVWFLAMDGGEIAGFALNNPYDSLGEDVAWVRSLGVKRPWRRRGIALALLHHTFREFAGRGYRQVGLSVDSQNLTNATALYEKAGMRKLNQLTLMEKTLRPGIDLMTTTIDDDERKEESAFAEPTKEE